jgi:hypothetical protein
MIPQDLPAAYVRFVNAKEGTPEYDTNYWAFDKFAMWCMSEPKTGWAAVVTVLAYDSSPRVLENIAAGPIEELLVHHGPKIIDDIERDAAGIARVREALGGVWRSDIDAQVWQRIEKLRSRKW